MIMILMMMPNQRTNYTFSTAFNLNATIKTCKALNCVLYSELNKGGLYNGY